MALANVLSLAGGIKSFVQNVFVQNTRQMVWTTADTSPQATPGSTKTLGGLSGYVSLLEEHRDDAQLTMHPIEQGSVISDHAFKLPAQLTLRIVWPTGPGVSNPIGGIPFSGFLPDASGQIPLLSYGDGGAQLRQLYLELLRAQGLRYLVTVYTGKRNYSNLFVESIAVHTDEHTENVLMATVVFREVIITSTQTVTSPINSSAQAHPEQTSSPVSTGQSALVPGGNLNFAAAGL